MLKKIAFFATLAFAQGFAVPVTINTIGGNASTVEIDELDRAGAIQTTKNKGADMLGTTMNRIRLVIGTESCDDDDPNFIDKLRAAGYRISAVGLSLEEVLDREVSGRYIKSGTLIQLRLTTGIGIQFTSVNYEHGKTTSQYIQECTKFFVYFTKGRRDSLPYSTIAYIEDIPFDKRAEVMLTIIDAYKKIPDLEREMPANGAIDLGNGFRLQIQTGINGYIALERTRDDKRILNFTSISPSISRLPIERPILDAFTHIATILSRP